MERKTKFIIIGLAGLAVIFFMLFMQASSSKQQVLQERDGLKQENVSLADNIGRLENGLKDYAAKISVLNKELDTISKVKQETQNKYEIINKEKAELAALVEKLKAQKAKVSEDAPASEEFVPESIDAYWAGILKAKQDLEFQLANIRSELKSAQINNEELARQKSALELDINALVYDKDDLKRQLEYNKKILESISQELVREKNDKIKVEENFKVLRTDYDSLSRQLKSLNNRKIELERKLAILQEDKAGAQRKIDEIEGMLKDKVAQIEAVKEQVHGVSANAAADKGAVELPPIVVRPQSSAKAVKEGVSFKPRDGKIMAVNRENNFVVIDLGQESGIQAGDTFQVQRGDKVIAQIRAIQARKDIAACDIDKEDTPVAIGDIVR
jgi:chromosome segregation ATPase